MGDLLLSILNTTVGVIGLIFGISSFIYALMALREKRSFEKLIHAQLKGMAGDVEKIRESAQWAWKNFDIIRQNASTLPSSNERKEILKRSQHGTGDAAATERMLSNLQNAILSLLEGYFGKREACHPDYSETEMKKRINIKNSEEPNPNEKED